jgi:hypothetical protein
VGILLLKKLILFQLTVTAGIFFYSCSGKENVPREKMVRVYTDLILAQDSLAAETSTERNNTLQAAVKEKIFRKHNVSPEDYEKTINFYNENPVYWESFFSRATIYLDSLKKEASR